MTEKTLFAGFGGQGIISLGQIWVYCAMKEGKNVSFFPFYGAEKRGGIARAGVIVSDDEIASPLVTVADSAAALNQDSLAVCEAALKTGGILLVNSALVRDDGAARDARRDIRRVKIDMQQAAEEIGSVRFVNMVALGAMARLTGVLRLDEAADILTHYFPADKHRFIPQNSRAIQAGMRLAMA
jgi:2-oxoglutarate ferredoxin oxidoreductase subunit gamma